MQEMFCYLYLIEINGEKQLKIFNSNGNTDKKPEMKIFLTQASVELEYIYWKPNICVSIKTKFDEFVVIQTGLPIPVNSNIYPNILKLKSPLDPLPISKNKLSNLSITNGKQPRNSTVYPLLRSTYLTEFSVLTKTKKCGTVIENKSVVLGLSEYIRPLCFISLHKSSRRQHGIAETTGASCISSGDDGAWDAFNAGRKV